MLWDTPSRYKSYDLHFKSCCKVHQVWYQCNDDDLCRHTWATVAAASTTLTNDHEYHYFLLDRSVNYSLSAKTI